MVRDIFANAPFHHLLVLELGELFGVVSDRDLLKALSPNLGTLTETWRDTITLQKCVHQIMSRKLIVIEPEADVLQAVRLLNRHRISCLPVVRPERRALGILTWHDLLRHWPGLKEADQALAQDGKAIPASAVS